MLTRILPPNSPIRRKLSLLTRNFNIAGSPGIRKNFSQPAPHGIEQLRALLEKEYFPSWYSGVSMDGYTDLDEGRIDLDNHLIHRLETNRYGFVPWVDSVVRLNNATILEIGCGTGSATVAMAEQGATVVALDVHRESLAVSELRARVHGVSSVSFIQGNAQDLKELVPDCRFDLIVFRAVLEHMNLDERKSALCAAWEILPTGKYICISETPNRLWFCDSHTSRLPFFNWLPDELAFEYSKFSPRYPFNARFRVLDGESMLSFIRDGRGFSFHEIDLALGDARRYKVVSDLTAFLSRRNPAKALKRVLESERKREKLLNSYAPDRPIGFFREYLDLVIEKLQ